MKVYQNIEQLPHFRKAVITIGTFDGVHLGHVQIIKQLLKEAKSINGTPVLITFFPHPKQFLKTDEPIYLLNTPEEKYALLHDHGISHIVEVPFNKSFSCQTAKEYIYNFLVDKFHPSAIIIGYDHRFGNNREGDYHLLEEEAPKCGFKVIEIPEHVLKDITISSTKIRKALITGDISTAASYLGYDYFFTATVEEGEKIGRSIGYPTANLQVTGKEKLIPANGVYAVQILVEGEKNLFKGMMNIGIRPTIGGVNRVIEVNIFDFNQDIYRKNVTVTFKKWLRNEIKFNGLEELKIQLGKDKIDALESFA